jgi:polyphosphate kinase
MVAIVSRKTSGGRLLNRELSTLDYSARLLDLAGDESLPLLERVRMCRYVSSNLDEFFMVRVAGLMGQAASGLSVRSADGLTPRDALTHIRERVLELTARQAKVWKKTLSPALAAEGIVLAQIGGVEADELTELEARF